MNKGKGLIQILTLFDKTDINLVTLGINWLIPFPLSTSDSSAASITRLQLNLKLSSMTLNLISHQSPVFSLHHCPLQLQQLYREPAGHKPIPAPLLALAFLITDITRQLFKSYLFLEICLEILS